MRQFFGLFSDRVQDREAISWFIDHVLVFYSHGLITVLIQKFLPHKAIRISNRNSMYLSPRPALVYGAVGAIITDVSSGGGLRLWFAETGSSFVKRGYG